MNQIHVCIHRGRYVVEQNHDWACISKVAARHRLIHIKVAKLLRLPDTYIHQFIRMCSKGTDQIHICIDRGRYVVYQKLTAHIQNSNKASAYACKAGARPGVAISVYTCVYTCKQASAHAYIHVLEIKSIGMNISWSCNKLNETHAQS